MTLIDECLSPELVAMAVDAGHVESTCVRNRGWAGTKDWQLIEYVVKHDYTLVTHNSIDFRGNGPEQLGGHHAKQTLHAGLVCLNSEPSMNLTRQRDLFQIALDELKNMNDLINQALEVFEYLDGKIEIVIYDIPAGS
ncbi:DUF5615 family PIN-like protein [Tahibacter amnicola]|uniref:DUF5615 family PIN-like protein n=1 Tax=Tahibacter amnicola TaxID=2976241 RepID=A0ABY6BH84_9GAMM|nr:DUF5615 family PIN-like protein [Tahibacter amnicola]UXI68872.1 DUF5615 family PIN-like protein [Tahibacter amnicola]